MRRLLLALLVALALPASASAAITYPDLSNNDPTYNMAAIKRHGHPAVVLKVNQGVGFLDHTFYYMALAAKRAKVCVGGYDFDQEYTAAETYAFIGRLHAAGIYRNTPCTLPPTLDVEFGVPSRAGLEHQLAVLFREYGRAQIYTGAWYWLPHFGCWVPPQVHLWLSGYPYAPTLCGMQAWQFVVHQYTDHGFNGALTGDMNVWRGSAKSWAAFVQAGPPALSAAQKRALKVRSLRAHERTRRILHGLLERHHCRKGQHVTPRLPVHSRRRYHDVLCPRWTRKGQAAIKVINRYHREGVR